MDTKFREITYGYDHHVATITINRPEKMNSVTPIGLREIEQALAKAERDRRVGVIVLTTISLMTLDQITVSQTTSQPPTWATTEKCTVSS